MVIYLDHIYSEIEIRNVINLLPLMKELDLSPTHGVKNPREVTRRLKFITSTVYTRKTRLGKCMNVVQTLPRLYSNGSEVLY
jgi:hypothetical protein